MIYKTIITKGRQQKTDYQNINNLPDTFHSRRGEIFVAKDSSKLELKISFNSKYFINFE